MYVCSSPFILINILPSRFSILPKFKMAADECVVQGSFCLLRGLDQSHLPTILKAVQKLPCMRDQHSDMIYLGTPAHSCESTLPAVKAPSQLLVELYRRHHKLVGSSGGKTILSADSRMVVLQLCLAEHNKQVCCQMALLFLFCFCRGVGLTN